MKYLRVIEYVNSLIVNSLLKPGDRLPSIREISQTLRCNKATVIRAYHELEMQHKIYVIPKSGYYLVEQQINRCQHSNVPIDFKTTVPDQKLLPYKEFNHCINKAIEIYKQDLFTYGEAEGLLSLRKVLVEFFWEQQLAVPLEGIFITAGAQQALSFLTQMQFPNNRPNILIEQPSYGVMQRLVKLNGGSMIGIKRTLQGIDLGEVEEKFKNSQVKFFYVISRYHNPLGTSLSEKTKKAIAYFAAKYDVYIVEDDYLGDLAIGGKSLPIYYYDTSGHVIYLRSFSKSFMPGIRLGASLLPTALRKTFLDYKRCYDLNTSVLAQGALEIFLTSGMYKNHLRKIKSEYQKKMTYATAILERADIPGMEYSKPTTGFFLWLTLPPQVKADILSKRLIQNKIIISTASEHYLNEYSDDNGIRLCLAPLSKQEIVNGIGALVSEIKSFD